MESDNIYISVVICTHKRPDSLALALESLTRQTWQGNDWEVLVVENDTQASPEVQCVIESFQDRLLLRWVLETVPNLSRARNRGAQEARGEYVAYIDDDDELECNWLEQLIECCRLYKPDICGGPAYPLYRYPKPEWYRDEYGTCYHYGDNVRELTITDSLGGMNFIVRRKMVEIIGGFRPDLGRAGKKIGWGEEVVFMRQALKRDPSCKVLYFPLVCVRHEISAQKMRMHWYIQRGWEGGHDYALVSETGRNTLQTAKSAVIGSLILTRKTLALLWLIISRNKRPWQQYVIEEMVTSLFGFSHDIAMITRRLRRYPKHSSECCD